MRKILPLLLMFGMLLGMSCENEEQKEPDTIEPEETVNPFTGTWEQIADSDLKIVFSNTVATAYFYNKGYSNNIYWSGNYTYDNKEIKIILDQEVSIESMIVAYPNGLIFKYNFENDLLNLSNPATMAYKKID